LSGLGRPGAGPPLPLALHPEGRRPRRLIHPHPDPALCQRPRHHRPGRARAAAHQGGTLVIVAGTILLSLSGRHVGFRVRHLAYPLIAAACFGIVAVVRKLGLGHAGALFDAAVNVTAAMLAATTFVVASGNRGALRCDRRTLLYFVGGGIAENTGVFLVLVALGFGD